MATGALLRLHNADAVRAIKQAFAPDGGAEREHNASAGTLGFGALHHSLIANLRPRRALVIGSRYGFVPAVAGLAMLENGCGELDFVDANYDDGVHGFKVAFGGVGHWSAPGCDRLSDMGLGAVVHVHVMRSEHFFADCTSTYNYIYLDGDHSYDGCSYDFEQAEKLAAPGALIVLHDVLVSEPGFGVGRLFASLDPERYDKIVIRPWPGLGLVQPRHPAGNPP